MNEQTKKAVNFFATPLKEREGTVADLAYELGISPKAATRLRQSLTKHIEEEKRSRQQDKKILEALREKCLEGDLKAIDMYRKITDRLSGLSESVIDNSYEARLKRRLAREARLAGDKSEDTLQGSGDDPLAAK